MLNLPVVDSWNLNSTNNEIKAIKEVNDNKLNDFSEAETEWHICREPFLRNWSKVKNLAASNI